MTSPPDPGGSPPEQYLTVFFDVFVLNQAVGDLLDRAMSTSVLSPTDYALYSALTDSPEVTPTNLASTLGVARATMTDWLRTVEGRGHVRRRRSPTDGRSWQLSLTAAGRKAHASAQEAFGVAFVAFLDTYPGEAGALSSSLREATTATRSALATLENRAN